jgi:hypothetical protein
VFLRQQSVSNKCIGTAGTICRMVLVFLQIDCLAPTRSTPFNAVLFALFDAAKFAWKQLDTG